MQKTFMQKQVQPRFKMTTAKKQETSIDPQLTSPSNSSDLVLAPHKPKANQTHVAKDILNEN